MWCGLGTDIPRRHKNLKPERLLDCYRTLGCIASLAAMQALNRATQPGRTTSSPEVHGAPPAGLGDGGWN